MEKGSEQVECGSMQVEEGSNILDATCAPLKIECDNDGLEGKMTQHTILW